MVLRTTGTPISICNHEFFLKSVFKLRLTSDSTMASSTRVADGICAKILDTECKVEAWPIGRHERAPVRSMICTISLSSKWSPNNAEDRQCQQVNTQ